MTDVELVNFVFDKLIAQGGCSSNSLTGCLYRGPDGRKCAAGHLIPDEDYRTEFEGKSCHPIPIPFQQIRNAKISKEIAAVLEKHGYSPRAVYKLQCIHDKGVSEPDQVKYFEESKQLVLDKLAQGQKLEDIVL